MNYNFLLEAKAFALGKATELQGLPLTPLVLYVLRRMGLPPLGAVGAVYLVAQGLFFVAAMSLFNFFIPEASPRRRILFLVVLAIIPLLSCDTAYADIAVLLGAGLLLGALACALSAAEGDRLRPGLLLVATAFAAVGGACRLEVIAGTVLAAILLLTFGQSRTRPIEGIVRPRGAAFALLVGSALGLFLALGLSLLLRGKAQLSTPAYTFYTFYDGLPYLMRPRELRLPGEYGRYLASMDYFGSFTEHHGSLLSALISHPGSAFLRFALKIPDLLVGPAWLRGITPLGFLFCLVGLRGVLRYRCHNSVTRDRAILLLAFLGPLGMLFVPPAADRYYLSVLLPLLLLIARGLDLSLAGFSDRVIRRGAAAFLLTGALLIVAFGRTEPSNSRVINEAAAYLESQCRSGCLVNYVPQQLSSQAWVDLESAAPFPPKIKRSEAFVLGQYPLGYEGSCRFDARVRRAREQGYDGPVLYVDVQVTSARVFSTSFDPEQQFNVRPDLSSATLQQTFESEGDLIAIYLIGG
jgi:hypothetical protein